MWIHDQSETERHADNDCHDCDRRDDGRFETSIELVGGRRSTMRKALRSDQGSLNGRETRRGFRREFAIQTWYGESRREVGHCEISILRSMRDELEEVGIGRATISNIARNGNGGTLWFGLTVAGNEGSEVRLGQG